ncbi:MAG: hypothetical protein U5Q44_09925 [Dehalococcoidia bacterium]|nr:hypothetical protein [Dehalococcoidia bacterium]
MKVPLYRVRGGLGGTPQEGVDLVVRNVRDCLIEEFRDGREASPSWGSSAMPERRRWLEIMERIRSQSMFLPATSSATWRQRSRVS